MTRDLAYSGSLQLRLRMSSTTLMTVRKSLSLGIPKDPSVSCGGNPNSYSRASPASPIPYHTDILQFTLPHFRAWSNTSLNTSIEPADSQKRFAAAFFHLDHKYFPGYALTSFTSSAVGHERLRVVLTWVRDNHGSSTICSTIPIQSPHGLAGFRRNSS